MLTMGRPKRPRGVATTINSTAFHSLPQSQSDSDYDMQQQQARRGFFCSSDETVTTQQIQSSSNDCYDQTMMYASSASTVHSSWLNTVMSVEQYSQAAVANNNSNAHNHHPGDIPLKEQTEAVYRQLCQIKRRLGPAAEQCATAAAARVSLCNSYNETITDASFEFQEARCLCNPFEELGGGKGYNHNRIFMNRAAIKLCNIDALLGFVLTRYNNTKGGGPFVFADICGAPGGFSEYIMYRCQNNGQAPPIPCKGYGMSLQGTNEHGSGVKWNLRHLQNFVSNNTHDVSSSCCSFHVCKGMDGTGDIYQWDNVQSLCKEIHTDLLSSGNATAVAPESNGTLVHLVVADGGFDAQRDSENQEELAQKIVVCQATAAIVLLRQGGTFVMKMFGFRTPTIRFLMEELYDVFEDILVLKPISSRPASAERYVVFLGYKGNIDLTNGVLWRNQIFLGVRMNRGNNNDNADSMECDDDQNAIQKKRLLLHRYLDEMDHSMMKLNSSACFQILSFLERKYHATVQNNNIDQIDFGSTNTRRRPVNIAQYKRAWKIV